MAPATPSGQHLFSSETLSAAGKGSERLSLLALQSKMKCDPEGYEAELLILRRHFNSSVDLFRTQSATAPSSDPAVAKDLGELAMFLAHVAPFYPALLAEFPGELIGLLGPNAGSLPSSLRCHLAQALILLVNRKFVAMENTLELFMGLQVLGDRALRKLAYSHVVHHIRRMNQNHKNEQANRKLQNILFSMLQGDDESRAKRSLTVICDLHRRRVWFDDRTANVICRACFLTSSRIMIAALSFLLGFERFEDYDSEESNDEDDTFQKAQVNVSKEEIYKAHHKGTVASKKKKKAKLQRAIRSMKRQQRLSSDTNTSNFYSPLSHLKDAQGFAETLFSRLQKCNERFEVRMMMVKVIARTVGLHSLILLNFYPYLQNYVKPGQRDVLDLLAAAVQSCHDMVPPDAVEPLFKQIVNDYVHDRSRPEAIAVGLNVTREICLRMPLLMNGDLLCDLVLNRKSHGKAVSTAGRSLMALFREICPSLLSKKDRGRPVNPNARPKAFGENIVASDVPGAELLQQQCDGVTTDSSDESDASGSDGPHNQFDMESDDTVLEFASESEDGNNELDAYVEGDGEGDMEDCVGEGRVEGPDDDDEGDTEDYVGEGRVEGPDDDYDDDDNDELEDETDDDGEEKVNLSDVCEVDDEDDNCSHDRKLDDTDAENENTPKGKKRKFVDYAQQINAADKSLRSLKRLAESRSAKLSPNLNDGIFSNEDFQRIKDLKAKNEAKLALYRQGVLGKGSTFKLPSSEQLSVKRVDPAKLEVNVKTKLSKEERLALIRAGREEREPYQARTAVKQKKTGGLSNRQKEHKKAMPLAAKRAKVARSRQEKRRQQKISGKQFRGRKAWK